MLTAIAVTAALYVAADILMPVTFAALLCLLLFPLVNAAARWRVPAPVASALVLILFTVLILTGANRLAAPAEAWLEKAPKTIQDARGVFNDSSSHLDNIQNLASEVDDLANLNADGSETVVLRGPGVLESVLGGLPSVVSFGLITIVMTFFLLASGRHLFERALSIADGNKERYQWLTIMREIRIEVSRYLLTVAVINVILGAVTAIWLHALGVDNPALWGVAVALLNFAPYVGALLSFALLVLVGFSSFDALLPAITVPAGFAVITILEGQFLTPTVLGQRMSMDPVFVFASVIFWGWLWGFPGALMAVPLTTALTTIGAHHRRTATAVTLIRGRHRVRRKNKIQFQESVNEAN